MVARINAALNASVCGRPNRRSIPYNSITLNNPANADAKRTAPVLAPNRRIAPASSHRLRGGFSRKGSRNRRGTTQSLSRCIAMAIPDTRASVEPCSSWLPRAKKNNRAASKSSRGAGRVMESGYRGVRPIGRPVMGSQGVYERDS